MSSEGGKDPLLETAREKLRTLLDQVREIQESLSDLIQRSGAVSTSDKETGESTEGTEMEASAQGMGDSGSTSQPRVQVQGKKEEEEEELKSSAQALKPLDSAELHTALAYLLSSAQVFQLKLANQDFRNHEVMESTLETVKTYMARLKREREKLEQRMNPSSSSSKTSRGPRLRVDQPAARRFVIAAVGPPKPAPPVPAQADDDDDDDTFEANTTRKQSASKKRKKQKQHQEEEEEAEAEAEGDAAMQDDEQEQEGRTSSPKTSTRKSQASPRKSPSIPESKSPRRKRRKRG